MTAESRSETEWGPGQRAAVWSAIALLAVVGAGVVVGAVGAVVVIFVIIGVLVVVRAFQQGLKGGGAMTWREKAEEASRRATLRGRLPNAAYLGGLSDHPKGARGSLVWDGDEIGVGKVVPQFGRVAWSDVRFVTTDADQIARRKTGAILAFGVLGGLGGRSTRERASLAVVRNDEQTAYFEIVGLSEFALRGRLAPALAANGISIGEPVAPGPGTSSDLPGGLAMLVEMHEGGALSDDEFAAAKARLLG